MKYIPQLYTGEMVCRIIAREKTVTHRPDKNGKPPCAVGDVIWVRETWRACDQMGNSLRVIPRESDRFTIEWQATSPGPGPWRPSIHMPRWASRLNLLVTDVRLERVQDITSADALLEGVCSHIDKAWEHRRNQTLVDRFHLLWDSIYGGTKYSWESNAPVWRIAFEVMA